MGNFDDDTLWINLGVVCEHCGKELECMPEFDHGKLILAGFEPMKFRHAHNKQVTCTEVIVHEARPYTIVGLCDKYYMEYENHEC